MKRKLSELCKKIEKSIEAKPAMWVVMELVCMIGIVASCFIQNTEARKAVLYISAGLGVNIALLGVGCCKND